VTNPTGSYGFRDVGLIDGADPNFGVVTRPIQASSTMYSGDPCFQTGGYWAPAVTTGASGAGISGVFESFEWPSIAAGRQVYQRYWLGLSTDIAAGGTAMAKIRTHEKTVFQARVSGASNNPITQAMVGNLVNYTPNNNLPVTGANLSPYTVDATTEVASSATLPFKIHAIIQPPESDPTSAGNEVQVIFNPLSFSQT
jgi:hypothetical protein